MQFDYNFWSNIYVLPKTFPTKLVENEKLKKFHTK